MLTRLLPGLRRGSVIVPVSKSHLHRLLVADFLAGDRRRLQADPTDSADIAATKRCLAALAEETATPVLDCGESGSTLRFLQPVAAALGKKPRYQMAGRLASRPTIDYPTLSSGVHTLAGNISSQFVTGLLFALPLLKGDSSICFSSPLQSRGYVDMTLDVLRGAGIVIGETPSGFQVPGGQTYRAQSNVAAEGDWSGASFWLAMNALGSSISVTGLSSSSHQPDRIVETLLAKIIAPRKTSLEIDVSQCPDIFPPLAVVAAGVPYVTTFTGIARLRLKECDRVAAMAAVLTELGGAPQVSETSFRVCGRAEPFCGGSFASWNDHRIAMSVALAATHAADALVLDNAACAAKSYPSFFTTFGALERRPCA